MNYQAGRMLGLNQEEASVFEWQYGLTGDFGKALFGAIMLADGQNLALLQTAYPDEVNGFIKYRSMDGWWDEVKQKAQRSEAGKNLKFQ